MPALTSNLAGDPLTMDSVLDTLTSHSEPGNTFGSDPLTEDSVLDTLTTHSEPANLFDRGDPLTMDSVLDTFTQHSEPLVVGLDWERDGWRVSVGGASCTKMSREALLNEPFAGIDLVIVEQAHMRERNAYSVAQVYTAEELRRLRCRAKIKLFPGMPGQLARAARAVGNVTTETNEWGGFLPDKTKDAETMAQFAAASPARLASWKPLYLEGEDPSRRLWEARDALRDDLKEALNPLRAAWNAMGTAEKYALPEVADFCALLDANFDKLSPEVKAMFGIKRGRNGIRVEKMAAALTCYLAVYTREGEIRLRPDGKFIGIRFILDSIGMSSSYKPNMARSQLTHHGMRWYGKKASEPVSQALRSKYMRHLRHFLQFLRDAAGDPLTADSVLDTLTEHSEPRSAIFAGDPLTRDSVLDTLTQHSEPGELLERTAT